MKFVYFQASNCTWEANRRKIVCCAILYILLLFVRSFNCSYTRRNYFHWFLLVLPKFHSFDGRISPEETLVKRRMHKSEHLKGILIILFNINLLSIQNILLSTVPVSPFSHPKHGKKASPIRLQIKFDWFLGLLKIAHLNSLSTQFIPKPKLEFVFRVQPAHRQSVMVHVSVSVACTAQFN